MITEPQFCIDEVRHNSYYSFPTSFRIMEFGARFLGWFDIGADSQLEYGRLAEKHGFDYCWFPHDTFMRNTWVLTSALAVQTKKIKIGSVGTNPYTNDPCEIATYVATLDEISHGRAVLGLGLHTTDMVGWVGIRAQDPVARTKEAVKLIRDTLRTFPKGKAEPFHGKEFEWSDQAYLRFKPFREDPPIYVAAFGKDYLELSGEIGDGSLPMITPPESSTYMVDSIRAGCRKKGRDPKEVSIAGFAWISISKEDPKKAAQCLKPVIAYFGPYLEDEALASVGLSSSDFKEIRREIDRGRYDVAKDLVTDSMLSLGITGTVEECIERIKLVEKAGVDQISLGGPWGPNISEAIEIVGERIIPAFR
ncbi:MAG: LLM class flavin-dependent oxidoreductase [Nitrososphaerota archaeon]|nr:LLM class flavin-dependent oxidoreductase [Nitrososphaerota archaeon]